MSSWRDGQLVSIEEYKRRRLRKEFDGNCHGCNLPIHQESIARVGPYWVCDACVEKHFPQPAYSENEATEIIQRIRSGH